MTLLLILILPLLSLAVTLDVIERGKDNIIARAGREIADSHTGKSVLRHFGSWGDYLGANSDSAFGATALGAVALGTEIAGILIIFLALRHLLSVLSQVLLG